TNALSPIDLDIGPDGALYYLSVNAGAVYRIEYIPAKPILQSIREPDQLRIFWPVSATGYVLQTTLALSSSGGWTPSEVVPAVSNGQYRVTIELSNPASFFRLAKPQ